MTEWKPRTHTRARKGGKLSKDRLPPLRLTPSAVGDRIKVYSIFSKIAAVPPRRVALARAKPPLRPQTTENNIKNGSERVVEEKVSGKGKAAAVFPSPPPPLRTQTKIKARSRKVAETTKGTYPMKQNNVQRKYRRVTERDRNKIEALHNAKVPVKKIAEELDFSTVTIYAELKRGAYQHRNTDWTETTKYSAYKAQRNATYNATSKGAPLKIGNDHEFARFVEKMILKGYSPEALLGYIKDNNLEFKTKVCRVTLYSYIDKGIFKNITNKNLLRKAKKNTHRKVKRTAKKLPNIEHSIEKRPEEIRTREIFGHWELDTVIGTSKKGKTLLAFTERKTRKELMFVSKDKTAISTVKILNYIERKLGARNFKKIFKSITCDNGTEFSNVMGMEYSPMTGKQRTTMYYCHPYCSSERGSNENQNAFIRRFIPKGTPISKYSLTEIKEIQDFINDYPRGIFDYKTSNELFEAELEALGIEKNSIIF